MTLVLSDGLFTSQTEDSVRRVVNAKWNSLKTLNTIAPIQTLDFCVSFSSVSALIGNLGQSNYAMANTIVDGYLARHKNAFSLSVPSVSHLGYFARYQGAHESNVKSTTLSPDGKLSLAVWNLSSMRLTDLCAYLEDGLLKLYSGVRAPYYIPDIPWNQLHKEVGLASDAIHLITREETTGGIREGTESNVFDKVLSLLDLSTSDFSPEVPFTSYGMDSLAATRISEALRPYIKISQMQLLGGMTWNHLETKMREASTATGDAPTVSLTNPLIEMVEKYSKNFKNHIPSSQPPKEDIIVITGTSGSVGTSVLVDCLKCPNVKHIYALNQPTADPVKAQKAALAKRGFDPSLVDTPKLTLLNADLTSGDLGIGESLLGELRAVVTHIIHAGWLINWSFDLSRFESLIRGTRNLIDLALSSPLPTPPRIVFISSVAVLRGCKYLFPVIDFCFHLTLLAQLPKMANCVPRNLLDQNLLWATATASLNGSPNVSSSSLLRRQVSVPLLSEWIRCPVRVTATGRRRSGSRPLSNLRPSSSAFRIPRLYVIPALTGW